MDLHAIATYLRPTNLQEVQDWDPDHAWLAGGTWLFSEAQPTLKTLVDLEPLQWSEIECTPETVSIGATCTLTQLQQWGGNDLFQAAIAALAASFKVTNMATVGGNLCLALAVGVMAPVMITLDATYEIWHPTGTPRFVKANTFQTGIQQTILQSGEVLRRVIIPRANLNWKTNFQRAGTAASDPALAMVAAALNLEQRSLRFVLAACFPAPILLEFDTIPTQTELIEKLEASDLNWLEDYRASAAYRKHLAQILLQRSRTVF
jgi:CO/xanthine dehydrogenase FAD-binding subunit